MQAITGVAILCMAVDTGTKCPILHAKQDQLYPF
jgi:hypothetical protein